MRRQLWKQAPLRAELLHLLAEDADFRSAVREAMQIPAISKALTAEEPAPTPVFHGPARLADKATGLHARRFEGGDVGYFRAREGALLEPFATPTASPSA